MPLVTGTTGNLHCDVDCRHDLRSAGETEDCRHGLMWKRWIALNKAHQTCTVKRSCQERIMEEDHYVERWRGRDVS